VRKGDDEEDEDSEEAEEPEDGLRDRGIGE
jgi:hypothetical protein